MDSLVVLLGVALGLAAGGAAAFLIARASLKPDAALRDEATRLQERLAGREREAQAARQQAEQAQSERRRLEAELSQANATVVELRTSLEHERASAREKAELLADAERRLRDTFAALSSDALQKNNQAFLELAKATLAGTQAEARGELEQRQQAVAAMLVPMQDALKRYDEQVQALERLRQQAYGSLTEKLGAVEQAQGRLQAETANLVRALRAPQVRGRWGEVTLQRVVEMAGLVEHCDFAQQASVETGEGRLRPDLVVTLPAGRSIVVDAKAPLEAYLEALEAQDDETRRACLQRHAGHVRAHVLALSQKAYWSQFQHSPEFVVLFIPGESFFSAALQYDPRLIEDGVASKVVLATPTTLIALLRTVAMGWREERIAQNAEEVRRLAADLYDRLRVLSDHFQEMGKGLGRTVDAYNRAVGSYEGRVLVSARKLREMGVPGQEIPALEAMEKTPRGPRDAEGT